MTEHSPRYDGSGERERLWEDVLSAVRHAEHCGDWEELAEEMGTYRDALLRRGFSEPQAVELVKGFQTTCLMLWHTGGAGG